MKVSAAMVDALTCSPRGLVWAPRASTIEALVSRGLATRNWVHTTEGLAVRDRYKPPLTPTDVDAILVERDQLRAKVCRYEAVMFDLASKTERAEAALCAHLECTREELTAGFELGDAPGSDADPESDGGTP